MAEDSAAEFRNGVLANGNILLNSSSCWPNLNRAISVTTKSYGRDLDPQKYMVWSDNHSSIVFRANVPHRLNAVSKLELFYL